MLPASLLVKAVQLCATGLGATAPPSPATYSVVVHAGAVLRQAPVGEADAVATVRELVALGADFEAGPLGINGRDFGAYGVTPASVFDACALAHIDDSDPSPPRANSFSISSITALLRRAFDARITDTIRPMSANYGARYSWHKFGQAVDFVPAGGVGSITRQQIRALMSESGVRLLELLGPGDPGHSNHWHIAFARPGQVVDGTRTVEGDEDWIVDIASADPGHAPYDSAAATARDQTAQPAEKAPPRWDVFAAAEWRVAHGGGS